jgi:hypothetical protein
MNAFTTQTMAADPIPTFPGPGGWDAPGPGPSQDDEDED